MTAAVTRTAGRPRDPGLDRAILASAEQQLRELGYAHGTPLDAASSQGTRQENVITWLRELGAPSATPFD